MSTTPETRWVRFTIPPKRSETALYCAGLVHCEHNARVFGHHSGLVRALSTVFQGSNGYASGYGGWPAISQARSGRRWLADLRILRFCDAAGAFPFGPRCAGRQFRRPKNRTILRKEGQLTGLWSNLKSEITVIIVASNR